MEHNAEYRVGSNVGLCRRTKFIHFLFILWSAGNKCIDMPSVHDEFLQLCKFGLPATQYKPLAFAESPFFLAAMLFNQL
jgi:hypothetical protein